MLTPTLTPGVTVADYNAAVLNGNPTTVSVIFSNNGHPVTLTGDNITLDGGITIQSVMNPETDLCIGRAISRQINIHILNNSALPMFDWTSDFTVSFFVKIGNTTYPTVVGRFIGTKPERTIRTEVIDFTAYDYMQKFDVLADDYLDSIVYPASMSTIYSGLCSYVGMSSATGDEIADVMAQTYTESPFTHGISCRTLLAWIAEANGCNAVITANNKVKLVWYTDHTSDYSLSESQYFEISIDENPVSLIDSAHIVSTENEVPGFIYPVNGANPYEVIDNPLLLLASGSVKTTFATTVVSRFAAIGAYHPTYIDALGNWLIETGDIISVDYDGNQTMSFPVFNRTFQWNGACGDIYECTGQAEREMTQSVKEQYQMGGKLANKYTVQSGVDITDEGVTISGGMYIKVVSGGIFDVQSANFEIDSVNGIVKSGKWIFDKDGLLWTKIHTNTYPGGTDHVLGIRFGSDSKPVDVDSMAYLNLIQVDLPTDVTVVGLDIGVSDAYLRIVKSDAYGQVSPPGVEPINAVISPRSSSGGVFDLGTSSNRFNALFVDRILGDAVISNTSTIGYNDDGYVLDARVGKSIIEQVGTLYQADFIINPASSKTLTADDVNTVYLITTRRNVNTTLMGCWLVYFGSSTATPVAIPLTTPGSNVSITAAANRVITIANGHATYYCNISVIRLGGTAGLS